MTLENDIIQHVNECGKILRELHRQKLFGQVLTTHQFHKFLSSIHITPAKFEALGDENRRLIDEVSSLAVDPQQKFRVEEKESILGELSFYHDKLFPDVQPRPSPRFGY